MDGSGRQKVDQLETFLPRCVGETVVERDKPQAMEDGVRLQGKPPLAGGRRPSRADEREET
jgi:hypothetical protein